MGLLSWIVFGLIAGLIAKMLVPGRDPGGCVLTVVLGVVGALIGGVLATALGYGGISGFDWRSLGIAVLGSILLLLIGRLFRRRR
ncbi:MAG TPA: GlsB/YeaQ/YmgE family stress response membrane protein [Thermoanaerobaculia bacterium]|nr:GlsB/YeaQ/YmgE family stress response membrane protein [Thermoanaerobaculia bacterium]